MPLSLNDLEFHLCKCADITRDAVDPTDYKDDFADAGRNYLIQNDG